MGVSVWSSRPCTSCPGRKSKGRFPTSPLLSSLLVHCHHVPPPECAAQRAFLPPLGPTPAGRSPPANAFLKHPASGRLHSALCPAAPSSAPCQTLGLTGVPSAQGNEPARVILSRGCRPPLSCRVLLSRSPGSPARPPPRPRPAGWPSCPLAPAFPSQNFAKLKMILYDFALFLLSPEGQKFSPISSVLYLQHLA